MAETSPSSRGDPNNDPVPISVLVVRGRSAVLRSGCLTPYAVEMMAESALQDGSTAALVVTVGATTNAAGLQRLSSRFDRLRERGVHVRVIRDGDIPRSPWPAA